MNNERPIRPEPDEHPKIQKGFKAAKFMKWWGTFLSGLSLALSAIVGYCTVWYLGLVLLFVLLGALFIIGYSQARCPHCGQVWWSPMVLIFIAPWWLLIGLLLTGSMSEEDETETFVCRRCRLNIGMGLK